MPTSKQAELWIQISSLCMYIPSAAFLEGTDCLCRRTICPVLDDHISSTPLASGVIAHPIRGAWIHTVLASLCSEELQDWSSETE